VSTSAELIARTVGAQDTPSRILTASASIIRRLLRVDSQPAEGLAFEARLAGEVRLFARVSGCEVRVVRRGERRDLPTPVEDLLVDAATEGLRNAVKHAGATLSVLHLAYRADEVVLVLQTEAGAGPVGVRAGTGTGLAGLRRRAETLRGTLTLTEDREGRKVLRLEVPAGRGTA